MVRLKKKISTHHQLMKME